MKNLFLLLITITLLSSCSLYRINSEDVTTNYYPSKASASEVVYTDIITEPHEVIGYVTVNAERVKGFENVIIKMKREAAILGGDAITDMKTDSTGTWKRLPAQEFIGNGYIRANFTATVVVFQ